MTVRLESAAVLGAGVMGSALAAHLAGCGIRTHLLDIVPPDLAGADKDSPKARNRFAESGIEKALKAKPAAFFDPDAARLITPGNLEDHLERLRGCDLVIEAVIEKLDIKRSLFSRIAPFLRKDVIVASNTSGLSLASMNDALPAELRRRFVVMHFFNPVRYMRLLEVVPGPETDPDVVTRAAAIGELLGKGIVYGKDTTDFVANRIGVHSLMFTLKSMEEAGLSVEEIDKIAGKPMGRPASAAFRTADLVGLDTLVHVAKHCYESLDKDEDREVFQVPSWLEKLVASGRLGQKSGAGFYKKQGDSILALDIKTLEYREQKKVRFDSLGAVKGIEDVGERLKTLVAADDAAGKFAWKALSRSLCYAAARLGEIADDIVNIDRAMRWGFNWELGPFEAWDAIGVRASVARMKKDGLKVPAFVDAMLAAGRETFYDGGAAAPRYYDAKSKGPKSIVRDARHIVLAGIHETKGRVIKENIGASMLDLGDGCLGVEVHTKMNTVDGDVIGMIKEARIEAEKNFEALVIGNDGEHFGAGANLMLIFMGAQQKAWDQIDTLVREYQGAMQALRFARVPVVTAPFGYTFAGACEIAMAGHASQAHAETYMGLVEVGVGIIPAGTGCLRMVERWTGDVGEVDGADVLPFMGQAALNLATAKVSTSAEEAKRLRFLRPGDGISLNRDHLLAHAKARALGMAHAGHMPLRPRIFKAGGVDLARTIGMRVWGMVEGGFATAHDALVAKKLTHILCGGDVPAGTPRSEQDYLDLEREAFLSLCGEEKSQARMQAMLTTSKPLRN